MGKIKFEIYTDGSCKKNPGPGGYAFIILSVENGSKHEYIKVWGREENTTNNRMELKAIIRGLKHLIHTNSLVCDQIYERKTKTDVIVYSDSAYCINAINEGWVIYWKENGWKTKSGSEVKNRDLWEEILDLLKNKNNNVKIKFEKVKGHSGNKYNEMVDKAAKKAIDENKGMK